MSFDIWFKLYSIGSDFKIISNIILQDIIYVTSVCPVLSSIIFNSAKDLVYDFV